MTKQITLEEALNLVSFYHADDGGWRIYTVKDTVNGTVNGNIRGDVAGNIKGNIGGNLLGKINNREWQFVETPSEKVQRWVDGASEEDLLKLINQLENN